MGNSLGSIKGPTEFFIISPFFLSHIFCILPASFPSSILLQRFNKAFSPSADEDVSYEDVDAALDKVFAKTLDIKEFTDTGSNIKKERR